MSEYEHKTPTRAGDVMLVPIGIGHCIENCSKDFRRLVIYSKQRLNVLVNPAMHLYESRFESKETVHKTGRVAQAGRRDVMSSGRSVTLSHCGRGCRASACERGGCGGVSVEYS